MRTRKRPLIEDDDEADTFINNSDLEVADAGDGGLSATTILPDGEDATPLKSDVASDADSISEYHSLDETGDAARIVSNKDASPTSSGLERPLSPNIIKEPTPPASAPATASIPDLNVTKLSFLHQQSDIQLQSPTKRRELHQQNAIKFDEPRLAINKLVLTNFKSYAGEQMIGPFDASFSAVVGPNGSGKSNVIDSMLFVLGFRALKMRQGKISELIHNSEGKHNKIDHCRVDIHFHNVIDRQDPDNADGIVSEVVPNLDLVISRKAFRNNSSQYYVNNKHSTYTEVTTFLKGQGIDLDHKRFLILQGEVESIAQMKAKAERENDDGLLEYLEDIIGTTKYKLLIEQNLSKVDELNDICLEKETRFELVEKDKNSLEDKKLEALKFLEMEKALIAKSSIRYQRALIENEEKLLKTTSNLNKLKEQLSAEQSSNKDLNDQIARHNKERTHIKMVINSIKEQENALSKKRKSLNKANVSIEEKVKNLTSRVKKAQKTIQTLESVIASSTVKLSQQSSESTQCKHDLQKLVSDLESEKATLDQIRKALTAKTLGFSSEIEQLQQKLQPWNDKVKAKDGEIALISSSIQMLNAQRESVDTQLHHARERLSKIKLQGHDKEAELRDTSEKFEITVKQLSSKEEVLEHQRIEIGKRKEQLMAMRQRTQDTLNSLNSDQNRNKVLSNLMRLAKSGRIDGFYGRLGDLGYIDDRYDVAISTAGGGGLDSMVVETVETAQACIDYLRKNKLGYANFICLNKLRRFDLLPITTPGNPATVKRLFDLIQPADDKFRPAFYSKVYNTLVAGNLQEAKQVAYGAKRWKVVTLDGKVVDTSGTMSGGGNYVSKGAMKTSSKRAKDQAEGKIDGVTQDDVDRLKVELNAAEERFDLMTRELQETQNAVAKLKELKPDLEFSLSRIRLDIDSLLNERKEAQQLCKSLIAESENTENNQQLINEIKAKETTKAKLLDELQNLKDQMVGFERQIKDLEEKILDAGGVELRLQNSKVDSIKQKIEILKEKLSNEKVASRKLENDVNRHTKVLEEANCELEAVKKDLDEAQRLHATKCAEVRVLDEELGQKDSEKEAEQAKLESLENELEEKVQQINDLRSAEIELEDKIEKAQTSIKRTEHEIRTCKESLADLLVRDVAPYIDWIEDEDERNKYNGEALDQLSKEQLDSLNMEVVDKEIESLEGYMETVKVDIEILKEYGSKKSEFESRRHDLNSAVQERDSIKVYCEELKRKRLDEFMEGFNTISMSLKEMYQMITMGGNAELELVDSLDPFSEGILFSVMPPKKSWKNISNLSGGEKTLSSLALVFALHRYKPTPLYVMDEIDAALDFRNVSIVANYIKERTKNAQFVVISLRNNMFELAQQLVGIYKVNNMTRSISLQNKDFLNAV